MNEEMTLEDFKAEVLSRIESRNEQLNSFFRAGKYEEMPGKFTLHSRIVTHEGDVIIGKDSENYWRKIGEMIGNHEERNLNFERPFYDAMELKGRPGHNREEFNFVAFEVTEFSFEAKGKTYNGYIDPPYRHRVRCDIDE